MTYTIDDTSGSSEGTEETGLCKEESSDTSSATETTDTASETFETSESSTFNSESSFSVISNNLTSTALVAVNPAHTVRLLEVHLLPEEEIKLETNDLFTQVQGVTKAAGVAIGVGVCQC